MWPFVRSQWYCAASSGGPPSVARGRGWCRAAILPGQFPHLFTVCDLLAGQTAAEEPSAAATRPLSVPTGLALPLLSEVALPLGFVIGFSSLAEASWPLSGKIR